MQKVIIYGLGSIGILLLVLLLVSFTAQMLFNQKVEKEVRELFNDQGSNSQDIITEADLEGVPQPVQKWLTAAQVVGKERITAERLKQKGVMRLTPEQSWMSFEANQYSTVVNPGFIWQVNVKMTPLLNIVGRDKYFEGKANMLIKPLALFTAAEGQGKEMDQGTLVRYLAEMVWLPTIALADFIAWEGIDENSAQATMTIAHTTATGIFHFNEKGEPIKFTAQRYREDQGKYSLDPWRIMMGELKEFDGIKIPAKFEVFWDLPTGEFNWFNGEVVEAEYNKPQVY